MVFGHCCPTAVVQHLTIVHYVVRHVLHKYHIYYIYYIYYMYYL